jgi:enoyl-CoA hydratase
MPDTPPGDPEICCETRGRAGLVVLNRPRALNALTHGMVGDLARALEAWERDEAVQAVVLSAAGERAFCAGGDIRVLYDLGRAGRQAEALNFWRDEYRLNIRIKRYPKPYVALIDGLVMGGGVGVSLHGSHRVAGDRYSFAMPEVGIGFFPDVGATYALPRLPGEVGAYLALTGARVGPDDAVAFGLATHAVPSAAMAGVSERLVAGEPVDIVLANVSRSVAAGPIARERAVIDRCFGADAVVEIVRRLDEAGRDGSAFAAETAAAIATKSPTSLALALAQMRRGAALSFEAAMAAEYRIVSRVVAGHDFYEGVRATIIDKDGAPAWRPSRLEDVDAGRIEAHFESLGSNELEIAP